jgi:outer membrane protein assembly factor BamA
MNWQQTILFSGIIMLLVSCSNTKHLGKDQALFTGSKEKIISTAKLSAAKKKSFQSELHTLIRPEPNSTILGARVQLAIYNMVKEPKKQKGLMYWLKYKVGEPPVLASHSVLEKNRLVLQYHLDNKGFFRDSVIMDTTIKNKKLSVTYTAMVGKRYIIRNISYPSDSSILSKAIQKRAIRNQKGVLLRSGTPYDLDRIKSERDRIDNRLKNTGYYYFSPDYLIADVDSTVGKHKVDIDMRVKPETPAYARVPYRIRNIYVFADYNIRSDTSIKRAKKIEGYTIIDPKKKFNPKMFSRTLVFHRGELYNRNAHNLSLNRLISLGVYKFVKVRFEPGDSARTLNAYYYLTPTNSKSIRLQLSGLQKSNNATGGNLSLNWLHRNIFKGAERLNISVNAGYEKQISAGFNTSILNAGVQAELYIPRILAPFKFNTNGAFVPQTKFSTGYQLYNSTTQYLLTSATASYSYIWKGNLRNENQLTPININYVKPQHITDSFQNILDSNITLQRSIEKQFIIGSIYNFNYNSLARPNRRRNNFYFNGNVDVSGNLLGLITGANANAGKQKKIFGTPFTQYVRLEADFRHYLKLGNKNRSLNSRLDAGIGYAFGNSQQMPFIKEFFAGGVSDLRGFRARTLGPGSYYAGNPLDTIVVDQPGDIKFLLSTEYRAKLFSIVRYALFADAGNVWTLKDDTHRPGSKFSGNFFNQVAIDAGAGLRFDISLLVLRLDVAFPLRVPYTLPGGEKYRIDFGSADWRRNNLVFNLAIGYPF